MGTKGVRSEDWFMWNAQWVLNTMVLNESDRNRIEDFMHYELNWGVAKKWIRQNYRTVERYRERNRFEFKLSFREYLDKFSIPIKEHRLF